MLATFSSKMGGPVGFRPLYCWVYVIFRFFGRPGPLLAQVGLDFGRFGPRLWRFMGSILEGSGHDLGPMCSPIWVRFWLLFFKAPTGNLRAGGVTGSAKNLTKNGARYQKSARRQRAGSISEEKIKKQKLWNKWTNINSFRNHGLNRSRTCLYHPWTSLDHPWFTPGST